MYTIEAVKHAFCESFSVHFTFAPVALARSRSFPIPDPGRRRIRLSRLAVRRPFPSFARPSLGSGGTGGAAGGENDTDDETVQRERLGEDKNEKHAGEELGLLRVGADPGVADDPNRHARGEAGEAARQAGGEVGVALEEGVADGVDCARGIVAAGNEVRWGPKGAERGRRRGESKLGHAHALLVEMMTAMMRP